VAPPRKTVIATSSKQTETAKKPYSQIKKELEESIQKEKGAKKVMGPALPEAL